MSKPEQIERESLMDLKVIVEKTNQWSVEAVVIGGYAVRAFTNAYRHTKDIDMAVAKVKILHKSFYTDYA